MSESTLESLHFADAPRIISSTLPGPKTSAALTLSANTESMARGGGRMPVAMDRAFGATFKDPDGNTYIDLSAGVGVSSVGRCHPKVVQAIRDQSEVLMHALEINSTRRTELAAKLSEIAPDGLRGDCIKRQRCAGGRDQIRQAHHRAAPDHRFPWWLPRCLECLGRSDHRHGLP